MNDYLSTANWITNEKATDKTPIEIALGIDKDGMTTAKKLFEFLEMHPKNYARWVSRNILDNEFAVENEDYFPFFHSEERGNPKPTQDYKLSNSFAKKLSMMTKNDRGEEAREYFITVEKKAAEMIKAVPTTTAGQIQLLAKGHVELEKKIDAVREDMQETKNDFEEFKQNCPCFPVELTAISDEVKKKGVSVMGGKSSNAYHDRSITQSVYRDIYSEIHRNFGCDTYKAIPRKHVPKVLELVKQYTLPIILQERIAQANT